MDRPWWKQCPQRAPPPPGTSPAQVYNPFIKARGAPHTLWFMVYDLGFMFQGLGFEVYGLWFMVYDLGFRFQGLWFMV